MISSLFINIVIVVSFIFLVEQVSLKYRMEDSKTAMTQMILGILFGVLGVVLMVYSYKTFDIIVMDLRYIVISLSAIYGGPLSAIISAFIVGTFRIVLFELNEASLLAYIAALATGVFCAYICNVKMSIRKKYTAMNIFGVVLTSINLSILIHSFDVLQNTYLNFWGTSLLGGIVSFHVYKFMNTYHRNYRGMEYYKMMTSNLTDIITTHKTDGTFLYVSSSVVGLLGYSKEELIGRKIYEFVHEEDFQNLYFLYLTLTQLPSSKRKEYRLKLKDGGYIWIESSFKSIMDKGGKVKEIICVSRDITARKEVDQKLIESNQKNIDVLESIRDAFFALDKEWRFTYLNETAEKVLGKNKQDVMGKVIWNEFPRIVGTKTYHEYYRAVNECIPITIKEYYPFLQAWYEIRIYPTKDGITAYILDITERIQLEEEVRSKKEQLALLIETTPSGIILLNNKGEITLANARIEELFGLKRENIIKSNFYEYRRHIYTLDGELFPSKELPFVQVMNKKQSVRDIEFIFKDLKDKQIILSINATPIFNKEGSISEVLLNIIDITESKKIVQEWQRLSKTDSLTSVANRRHFDEILEKEWLRAADNLTPLSLIMLDIDYFKKYNDNYGHQAGDECLKTVAKVLSMVIKGEGEIVARYGGEEFSVILPETSKEKALIVGEQLRSAIEKVSVPLEGSKTLSMVTCSIGIATLIPNNQETFEILISKADNALYQAKREGRNRLVAN